LAQFPSLKAADVRAQNFHTIAVSLIEREPKALWCGTGPGLGNCSALSMDDGGRLYAG
jgi:hypothetical protein